MYYVESLVQTLISSYDAAGTLHPISKHPHLHCVTLDPIYPDVNPTTSGSSVRYWKHGTFAALPSSPLNWES